MKPQQKQIFSLTDNEKHDLRQAFNLFDKDGSGTIEASEFRVVLRVLGFNPTQEELHTLISSVCNNQNERIDFNEFTQILMKKISEPQPKEMIIQSFNNLDIDMDGYLSLEDLTEVSAELENGLTEDELKEIILSVKGSREHLSIHSKDVGKITQSEFLSAIKLSADEDNL
ncbi:EF hand family protein [Histomonas meleagridis]|uniref:EF hand family protein n=1 Tax=Histomonas meleagridis TaxID=135588 RepID=UPI003559C740|nr:EF hand family protein [Histomonas meleagridis]KAH0804929.1 EF hand family protein [Histomonas meleagridis]